MIRSGYLQAGEYRDLRERFAYVKWYKTTCAKINVLVSPLQLMNVMNCLVRIIGRIIYM